MLKGVLSLQFSITGVSSRGLWFVCTWLERCRDGNTSKYCDVI